MSMVSQMVLPNGALQLVIGREEFLNEFGQDIDDGHLFDHHITARGGCTIHIFDGGDGYGDGPCRDSNTYL